MRRLSKGFAVLAFTAMAAVPILASPAGATQSGVPTSPAQCKHGGWMNVTNPVGVSFRTQGRCTTWAQAHPGGALTLADFNGSFTGTQSTSPGCTLAHQVFDASYVAQPGLGVPTIAIDACIGVSSSVATYTGTFTLTTGAGNVTGTVSGTIQETGPSASSHLNLASTSGTGYFSSVTGSLSVDVNWDSTGGSSATTGTVLANTLITLI
jgi:hypothetical protein